MSKIMLKGDQFSNRYRFKGTLTTRSPLHIGTGKQIKHKPPQSDCTDQNTDRMISTIIKDSNNKPLIPGSTLRGVMRHWLLGILKPLSTDWADQRDFTDNTLVNLSQREQIEYARTKLSWLELLFGTPFHEGKIEVWDAICLTDTLNSTNKDLSWDNDRLTYITTSVAIDPATGTALDNLLYNLEVVPSGVKFEFNITGQNLSEEELGLLLLAFQGFNSQIHPIQIGADSARGYGRVELNIEQIYMIKQDNLKNWIKQTIESFNINPARDLIEANTGYFDLPLLGIGEQEELILQVKRQIIEELES